MFNPPVYHLQSADEYKTVIINILLCYEPFITCLYPDEWETGGHVKETVKVQ